MKWSEIWSKWRLRSWLIVEILWLSSNITSWGIIEFPVGELINFQIIWIIVEFPSQRRSNIFNYDRIFNIVVKFLKLSTHFPLEEISCLIRKFLQSRLNFLNYGRVCPTMVQFFTIESGAHVFFAITFFRSCVSGISLLCLWLFWIIIVFVALFHSKPHQIAVIEFLSL